MVYRFDMRSLTVILIVVLQAVHSNADAYIMYSNSRIDHALYDGHDPKTIVMGKILTRNDFVWPKSASGEPMVVMDDPTGPLSIAFRVEKVVMGDGKLQNKKIDFDIQSFMWPVELVPLDTGTFCILIMNQAYQDPTWRIVTVVPVNLEKFYNGGTPVKSITDNYIARLFLEEQLLAELKHEKETKRQQVLLEQVGPITSLKSENVLLPFTKSVNEWVKRAALAALVFATQKQTYIQTLAADVNAFFTRYASRNDMIGGNFEYNNYSAWHLYYRFVFFLDPDQRKWGSRWDENEFRTNEKLVAKLKATGLLSKKVQDVLKC
ncbi:MAG TPA: hypothetical protein VD905_06040 [Flavobacteriales bacterium]|nr:hypothetical protein [Flavobacteriales bacterium]